MKSYFTLFAIHIMATGSALGAGSASGGAALKTEQGAQPVQFLKMGRKADAEKDLATLKALKPKLADELEEVIQTGKEED